MIRLTTTLTVFILASSLANAQPFGRGPVGDKNFTTDRDTFQYLLSHRDKITRRVTELKDGVETLTESNDPEVAAKIREHVKAMYGRVEDRRPIHMRDPLFLAVFENADKIRMDVEATKRGVKVKETSTDPAVAKLIRAHAKVVSLFLVHGHAEVRRSHAHDTVEEASGEPELSYPVIKGYGGVVSVPDATEMPRANSKLVIDLTTGETKDGINIGLEKVARFVNLYAANGLKSDKVMFTVVIHGAALPIVLNEESNSNLELLGRLRVAGVKILVCGQALAHAKHQPGEVSEHVTLAYSALTALVNRQADGYGYVPLK